MPETVTRRGWGGKPRPSVQRAGSRGGGSLPGRERGSPGRKVSPSSDACPAYACAGNPGKGLRTEPGSRRRPAPGGSGVPIPGIGWPTNRCTFHRGDRKLVGARRVSEGHLVTPEEGGNMDRNAPGPRSVPASVTCAGTIGERQERRASTPQGRRRSLSPGSLEVVQARSGLSLQPWRRGSYLSTRRAFSIESRVSLEPTSRRNGTWSDPSAIPSVFGRAHRSCIGDDEDLKAPAGVLQGLPQWLAPHREHRCKPRGSICAALHRCRSRERPRTPRAPSRWKSAGHTSSGPDPAGRARTLSTTLPRE